MMDPKDGTDQLDVGQHAEEDGVPVVTVLVAAEAVQDGHHPERRRPVLPQLHVQRGTLAFERKHSFYF